MDRRRAAGALLALAACIACSAAAPTLNEHTSLDLYDGTSAGCYYNFQHYGEGDRIMTNEPCLNCTCHNRMLMCYLRVCPFTKPIGQDCTVEKRADQCCPIVTCPDVPVDLLTSTSTTSPAEYGGTGVGKPDKYGCSINGRYFPEGSKVPPTPNKPCEHCYCIRNMTTCVMQECTLHVDGCTPIYHKDVCCPVRYSCDHLDDETLLLDDMTTTVRPTPGFLLTTTIPSPVTQMSQDCVHDDKIFADGALIKTEKACEHCYCMKGDIVCVVQECGTPMENEGKNCTSLPPREGQCCPDTYICEGDEIATESLELFTTEIVQDELTTLKPPRRYGVEGSGYRKEPDNTSYTATPSTETEIEGSGYEEKLETPQGSNEIISSTVIHEHVTTKIPVAEEIKPEKEITEEKLPKIPQQEHEKTTTISEKYEIPSTTEEVQKVTNENYELDQGITNGSTSTEFVTKSNKEEFIGETTQENVSLPEENISTITSELGSKAIVTTETVKHDLSTIVSIEENDISITTSSTIFEESEGVTTDKEHKIISGVLLEKERPLIGEYNPSTSSTPFLEEVEKVTTQTQEQHIVTDNISETEAFGPHKYASTITIPKIEVNKESDTISGDNTLPDTESHEYIPIATSAPIGDESEKGITSQVDMVTSDFTEEEINKSHKYTPSTINSILEDNEFITTETNRESSVSNEVPKISEAHSYISSTTIGLDITSEDHKLTTEVFEHDIVTDRTRKDDDTYHYTLTTTSMIPMAEESLVTVKEKDEKVIISASTEIDKTTTDKYIATTLSAPHLEEHKTTVREYGDEITEGDSKEGSISSEKDFSNTGELSFSKPVGEISTELNKYETSTTKLEDKESYESHKLHSTGTFGIEEDYITTTEYTGKGEEFISHEISESGTKASENIPDASSTPFLEEIEKATPEVSEHVISSIVGESDIHTPEKHLPSTDSISKLDEEVTTIIESDNMIDVTPPNNIVDNENFGLIVPEKTTQDETSKYETTVTSIRVTDEKQTDDIDSVTTDAHSYSTSSLNSFITKEDQLTATTEPSFRKEDNYVQSTLELSQDITTSIPNIESSTIIDPIGLPHENSSIPVYPEYIHESHKPVSLQETTVKIITETVTQNKDNLPVSVDEELIVTTTHALDKNDLFETSTINFEENEIHKDILTSVGRIPGEGDCLLNGVTYINESAVPSTNKCHSGCKCLSSIITCDPIICSPPPEYMDNCQPTYDSPESCCPTYVCDQVRETLPPLPYKHVTTPETPKQSIAIECHGDECEISKDKKQSTVSSELCATGSCSTDFDHQDTSKCGPQGCTEDSQFSVQNVPSTEKSELCVNGKCEQPLVQVPEEELCKGDNCKSVSDTLLHGSQQDSKPQEVSSIPCIGETCTNIISEPHDTAAPCNEHNGCTVNQDTIGQECTDDSCRRKETINVGHTPLCSGINCEHNQIPSGEPPKNIHHSTYEPIVEQSTETEATPILSLSPDILTRPVEQHAADESSSGDEIPNFISEDKEVVTELPEIVTLSIHSTDIEKDSTSPPDMLITESQEPFTYEPQKPIGESHIIGSKQPIVDEQQSPTKQPSIIVPEDITHNIGYETSTGVSEDKLNKEEVTGIIVDQPEDNIVKLQDQTKAPNLPISEIGKETILPETTISTSLDTNTRAPTIDELVTTILDTAKHEVSTAQSHEYTTSMPYRDEVESGTTISTHISVTYETSSDVISITNSPDIMSITENSIEVTASKKPLTSLNNQELTTAKFETDHVNDYTTLANDLELEQVNRNTDLPDQSDNAHDEFEKNKSSTTGKPDAESYGTNSQKVSVTTQETTESLLTEKEYTDFVPSVTHKTDADDSRTDSPLFNTIEEKLDTEAPLSHITESGDYAMEDDKTKTTLPTFETHEKRTETDSSSAVTEFEVHMPEIDVSRTTSPAITIEGGNVEVETTASLVTEPEKHVTVLPTFVTKEENIESGTSVAPVTEVELQKDKIDQVKEISQTFVTEEVKIQPETTSLLVTESASPVDERKTTLQQDEDNIVTGSPDSQITESVDYATHLDETKTTSPTTYFDKNENIQTDAPSIYMTEPAPHYTETEEIRTTLTTLIVKEETMKPEYSSSQVTEKGTFTSETYDKGTTLAEHITEQEKIYTQTPSSQFTKVEEATTELDETKTTSPTFTDEKVEAEFPVTVVTELNPHPDEVKETKTTIPTYSKEEEKNIIQTPSSQVVQEEDHSQVEDEAKTTLATFITTEKTIKEGVPTSFVTESEAYLSTLDETSVTLPTYITEVQKINEEPESEVSPVTVLGLHKDKENESNTVLPLLHVETESPVSYIPELESHTNDAAQTNILPVTNVEDEKIESQFTSSYVTESGIYTTDIDKRKSTLSEIVPEKEKLDSEVPMSPVTESQSQANGIDKTGTITPSSIIQDDVTKTDSQSPHVTEPEVYVSEIYETKTTIPSSTTKEVNIEEMTPTTQATQTVSFEIETKIPTVVTETENIISEFAASTEKEIELQTNEIEETQTIQPIPFAEEGKTKLEAPLSQVTESGHHTGKLDETKTTLPVFVNENKNVATETSYSQVTESIVHATVVDETRTTSSVPHLIEEGKFETELTTSDLPESEDHTSKVEEAKTTSPELSITEKDITGSESPASYVTEAEIYGTETVGTSSSLYTSLPEVEKHETEAPAYHTSISEVYATVINKTKTTTPAFITVEDNIKTEAPNVLGTELVGLITEMIPDRHKLSTLSEHLFTESEVHTTEISTIQVITVEDTDNINVEREQDNVKVTTELNVSGTFTHVKPDATSNPPLTENATEKEFVENVTTGEEDKLTTENSKVESMSSVGISEIGATQGYELATKVPEASLINEIYPGLQVTEGEKLSTDITEATSIGEGTDLSQDHYSQSPELLPVTTISAVAESEKLYTSSVVEDIQTPPTTDPQNSVNQHAVTTESEIDITASEVLETQKQIVTETEIMSTELPHTISSYTDIPAHPDLAQSTVPVVTQGQLTSSEPETPYIITLAPESLTTNLQEVSQTNLDEHHINEEEQTKIKPLVDSIDSSTIKSEMMTISQEQYFTEKQETIPIEYDSSTVSQEITTKKPDATEINVITTTQIQEDTTEHEQTKHTYVPVSENTETLPDVIELEEHTHKTLSEITTVSTIDDQSFIQTNPEKVDLEHQTPEKSTEKSSYEQHDIKESTAINEDTSTSFYEVEKSTVAAVSVEKTSEEIQGVNTTPVTTKQEESSTTSKQEETATSILTQVSEIENVSIPETSIPTEKPSKGDKSGTTTQIDEITVTTLKPTSPTIEKESQAPVAATPISETKPNDTSLSKVPKPVISATQPPDEISPPPEEEHFPSSGSSGYGGEPDYVEEDQAFGPGTCRYGGKVYVSAQQIPRDDPCDFCFCFRSDIICLQQSCPPPIHGCHEEPIQGFCCPRYECPVSMATTLNVTTTTTTTTTTLPPHFPTHSYKGAAHRRGCQIKGHTYKVGEVVRASSGPCLHCTCGGDGQMKCDPKACTPEPMLRQMIAAAVSAKRRR